MSGSEDKPRKKSRGKAPETEVPLILSPYHNIAEKDWNGVTDRLIKTHPLDTEEIVESVLTCWKSIFASTIAGFKIGKDITPKPQIMGFLLHELIPLDLARRHPGVWFGDKAADDKDLVYIPDPKLSVEIKTSSHARSIFGNRSYAQPGVLSKKSKDGYYITVNFEKFGAKKPEITLIRFGWLDYTDWVAQAASTGQQAHIKAAADLYKLKILYPSK